MDEKDNENNVMEGVTVIYKMIAVCCWLVVCILLVYLLYRKKVIKNALKQLDVQTSGQITTQFPIQSPVQPTQYPIYDTVTARY